MNWGEAMRLFGRLRALARPAPLSRSAGEESGARAATGSRCPLCGRSFEPDEAAACAVCPLLRRCGLVMCPNCGYEFAP